jgi:site-specific DNA-methyltransferase (cytosine-N4-specific)
METLLKTKIAKELVRDFNREGALLEQLASLTQPSDYDTAYLTHGIHPYPAKYIPQLPNLIIREHTDERNVVLDPFCGSGTTLLESTLLGRRSVGVDSNAVAHLISTAKTGVLSPQEIEYATDFAKTAKTLESKGKKRTPIGADDVNLSHWFQSDVTADLLTLREHIDARSSGMPALRSFLRCIYSSIIVGVSNQESETRYAAIKKDIAPREVFRRFSKKLEREIPRVAALSESPSAQRAPAKVYHSDIRRLADLGLKENSIDLVVTSPPYPNSFDYYLYHKWRLFWLGYDFREVMAAEIGSRNEHSSRKQPMASYVSKMREALKPIATVLKPSKLAYFFVGDAVIAGEFHDISQVFKETLEGTDLRLVADNNYSLEKITRSFHEKTSENCHGGRRSFQKRQHILVLEKVNKSRVSFIGARTQATPTHESLPVNIGETQITDGEVLALKSNDEQRHVHSIGRYPSKFIPEIPRWAIQQFSAEGDVVLDPFGGSGTTAVEAMLAGRRAIISDVSPYSILL